MESVLESCGIVDFVFGVSKLLLLFVAVSKFSASITTACMGLTAFGLLLLGVLILVILGEAAAALTGVFDNGVPFFTAFGVLALGVAETGAETDLGEADPFLTDDFGVFIKEVEPA